MISKHKTQFLLIGVLVLAALLVGFLFVKFNKTNSEPVAIEQESKENQSAQETIPLLVSGASGYSVDSENLFQNGRLVGSRGYQFSVNSNGRILSSYYPTGTGAYGTGTALFVGENEAGTIEEIQIAPQSGMRLQNGKIYFINPIGALNVFDLSSRLLKTFLMRDVQLLDENNRVMINDYYIVDNNIYILHGKNCLQYLAPCDSELLKYNITTSTFESIASHLPARSIRNIDELKENLVIKYSDGDVGMYWIDIFTVNLKSKTVTVEKFQGNLEFPDDPNEIQKQERIRSLIGNLRYQFESTSDGIQVRNGVVGK